MRLPPAPHPRPPTPLPLPCARAAPPAQHTPRTTLPPARAGTSLSQGQQGGGGGGGPSNDVRWLLVLDVKFDEDIYLRNSSNGLVRIDQVPTVPTIANSGRPYLDYGTKNIPEDIFPLQTALGGAFKVTCDTPGAAGGVSDRWPSKYNRLLNDGSLRALPQAPTTLRPLAPHLPATSLPPPHPLAPPVRSTSTPHGTCPHHPTLTHPPTHPASSPPAPTPARMLSPSSHPALGAPTSRRSSRRSRPSTRPATSATSGATATARTTPDCATLRSTCGTRAAAAVWMASPARVASTRCRPRPPSPCPAATRRPATGTTAGGRPRC